MRVFFKFDVIKNVKMDDLAESYAYHYNFELYNIN